MLALIISTFSFLGILLLIFYTIKMVKQNDLLLAKIDEVEKNNHQLSKDLIKLANFTKDINDKQTNIISNKINELTKIEELK